MTTRASPARRCLALGLELTVTSVGEKEKSRATTSTSGAPATGAGACPERTPLPIIRSCIEAIQPGPCDPGPTPAPTEVPIRPRAPTAISTGPSVRVLIVAASPRGLASSLRTPPGNDRYLDEHIRDTAISVHDETDVRRRGPTLVDPALANRLLTEVTGTRFELAVAFALLTGMRRGEILGLRWSDLDPEHSVAHVRRTLGSKQGSGSPLLLRCRRRRVAVVVPAGPTDTPLGNPIPANIRQIAFEVDMTLTSSEPG